MSAPSPNQSEVHAPSRHRLTLYAAGTAGLLIAAFFLGWIPRLRQRAAVVAESRDLSVPTVLLVSPSRGASTSSAAIRLPAEIRALSEAPILARATGYLKTLHVDIGSAVTQGQLLAELETPELNQQLASARALKVQAEAALHLAQTTARRWGEMRQSKIVSAQEADEKAADAELKAAALNSASSEVRRLEELIGFGRITAPFDGLVTQRKTDLGQLVVAGSGIELFRVAQIRSLRVFVRLPQTLIAAARPDTRVTVVLPDGTGNAVRRLEARLIRTAGAVDPASRTLLTELELPNPDRSVMPGAFAQVEFPDPGTTVGLTVPANTLLFRPEGLMVAAVDSNSVVEIRLITPGRDFGASLEVTSGIDATTRLILNPPDSLSTGMRVRLAAPEASNSPKHD